MHSKFAVARNLQAACAVARSFLGPGKALKCIIDESSESRNILAGTIQAYLLAADGDPTASTLLLEALESQTGGPGATAASAPGSGATWLAAVCGLLLGGLLEAVEGQGVPYEAARQGLLAATAECCQVIRSCAVEIPLLRRSSLARELQQHLPPPLQQQQQLLLQQQLLREQLQEQAQPLAHQNGRRGTVAHQNAAAATAYAATTFDDDDGIDTENGDVVNEGEDGDEEARLQALEEEVSWFFGARELDAARAARAERRSLAALRRGGLGPLGSAAGAAAAAAGRGTGLGARPPGGGRDVRGRAGNDQDVPAFVAAGFGGPVLADGGAVTTAAAAVVAAAAAAAHRPQRQLLLPRSGPERQSLRQSRPDPDFAAAAGSAWLAPSPSPALCGRAAVPHALHGIMEEARLQVDTEAAAEVEVDGEMAAQAEALAAQLVCTAAAGLAHGRPREMQLAAAAVLVLLQPLLRHRCHHHYHHQQQQQQLQGKRQPPSLAQVAGWVQAAAADLSFERCVLPLELAGSSSFCRFRDAEQDPDPEVAFAARLLLRLQPLGVQLLLASGHVPDRVSSAVQQLSGGRVLVLGGAGVRAVRAAAACAAAAARATAAATAALEASAAAFRVCFCRLVAALRCGRVLPGGGAWEVAAAEQLELRARALERDIAAAQERQERQQERPARRQEWQQRRQERQQRRWQVAAEAAVQEEAAEVAAQAPAPPQRW
uniref:Putative signal transducer for phototaxis n=1 Tax=Chlamydomonas reinhardtii TaxID=3055 RepID=Q5DW75_CHLRE|nr:putative signal transducer for phototaxis [Chlamydomonas reinhardtii]|eukprot:XP_001701712.1 signal transducer for phototaxis [Chlamydomonas reinhardtii]